MIGHTFELIDELRRLYLAMEPRDVYDALQAIAPRLLGAPFVAAGIVRDDGTLLRDPDAGGTAGPERWDPMDGFRPGGLVQVVYSFRSRPMGALLFDPNDPIDAGQVREALEAHFAPVLFRAAWLADALGESARTREQVRFLLEMGRLLGHLDLEHLLVTILGMVCEFLDAPIGCITLLEEHGNAPRLLVEWGLPLEALRQVTLASGEPLLDEVAQRRSPRLFDGAELRVPAGQRVPDRLLILPLMTGTSQLGLLACVSSRDNPRLTAASLEVVEPAIGLAATAIENARLVLVRIAREKEQEQLDLARRIQAGLLPAGPPPVEGIEVAASSLSANLIGGDYYDYFILPDGTLGIIVADVAGKGVAAGLIMTAARATFRAVALQCSDPAGILTSVNRTLSQEDFNGRFVTAVMTRIDLARGRLAVCCAGHEPLMLRRAPAGPVERLGTPALPLGIVEDVQYAAVETSLGVGDLLLLYTDGVTEAMSPERVPFGRSALQTLLATAPESAEGVRDAVLAAAARHMKGAPRHDDTTLVAARVLRIVT